jgi:membrane protease YdiL (CAAX protease family)
VHQVTPKAGKFKPWVSVLCAASLAVVFAFLLWPTPAADELSSLRYPGESAGRMMDRHLGFYEGIESVPTWQRVFFTFLFGSRSDIEDEAIGVFNEVLVHLQEHPEQSQPWVVFNTQSRLLVTLAESGRWDALHRALGDFDQSPEQEATAEAIRYAYFTDHGRAPSPEVYSGAAQLPLGWALDRLHWRIADKANDPRSLRRVERRMLERAEALRERVLILSGVIASLIAAGVVLLVRLRPWRWHPPWGQGVLGQPWSGTDGLAVILRAAFLGILISLALALYADQYFRPGIWALWSALFASIPMMWLMYRHLLRPRGLTFRSAFGLSLRGVGVGRFAAITLSLLAVEWSGMLLIAWAGWHLGWETHWSQGLSERMVFGPWETTVLGGINVVVWTAVFEEIGFRGLLYVTLRAWWRPLPAALACAGIFSALHLYSIVGFLSVFWTGLVLCYAFERFRSLLPGMIVHGASNMLTLSTVLLFYR